jgi:hypothetical protein
LAAYHEEKEKVTKVNQELRKRFEEYVSDESWKQANTRLCPNCQRVCVLKVVGTNFTLLSQVINKLEGCDVMRCGRDYHGGNVQDGCGATFRWSEAKPYIAAIDKGPQQHEFNKQAPSRPSGAGMWTSHGEYRCDNCHNEIIGFRFSCIHCRAFDLCDICEAEVTPCHPRDHIFAIFTGPLKE